MARVPIRPGLWFAWGVIAVAFLLPVGSLFVHSFQVIEVVERDGTVHRAVGDVQEGDEEITFQIQASPDAEKEPWSVDVADKAEIRTVFGLDHYKRVFGGDRTLGLLRNSLYIALGGALLAMLLGVPMAWILARTHFPARPLVGALCLGPAILPPFFIALGGAREMQSVLIATFGVEGGTLQILNAICVFGCVLFPLYVLLVAPALSALPAGPWEAATILRGPRAAFRHVLLPAVLPSIAGAFVLTFLIALADFAVPDVLGFMLPAGGVPKHVFATEILLQWKQTPANTGRAVATGAPYILITILLLAAALWLLRRSPIFTPARSDRRRPRIRLGRRGTTFAALFVVVLLGASLILPLVGIASWTGTGGESASSGTEAPVAERTREGTLFDFSGALDNTGGGRKQRDRWLLTAAAAALLAMAIAIPLARQATRGGRVARLAVLVVGALPLAVPGIVFSAGTLLFWQGLPNWVAPLEDGILRSTLVLAARFLPFALLAAWLTLRGIRRGHEEAAAMLGASPAVRAWRILTPLSILGVLSGGLAVLVLALRELDAVILVDARILPMRLYDKIHFNRMADEANLLFLCVLYLLGPALICMALLALRRRSTPR